MFRGFSYLNLPIGCEVHFEDRVMTYLPNSECMDETTGYDGIQRPLS